ncbi:MAG TPA: M20/M25/M40 family metallo-hydrolase [Pyrinomonadaceae bacterium]|nr:M20/M25/M40 family metallo-hydrolase [Pyrinomonadaceae bacterium]
MKKSMITVGLIAISACFVWAWTRALSQGKRSSSAPPGEIKAALESINANDLLRHIKVLASDEFEGRAPGSKGEELTVEYLTRQFKQMGLKPGNGDGTYVQKVSLVGLTAQPNAFFDVKGKRIDLKFPEDYVAMTRRVVPEVIVEDSEMVFVGYGVVAPEYGWDDYKGLDVKGKTIVMLINDPAVPDPQDPSKLDEQMFKGRAMTYYGRWTYKYEIAAEKGAAAAIIVHETDPAGYPYSTVISGWAGENFDIKTPDKNMNRAAVESWIRLERAQELFAASGQDFAALKRAARSREFKPVALDARASFRLKNEMRETESHNVIAKLEGSDPKLKDEYVIYSAHWDAFGRNEKLEGDQILNGALDNASGVAEMLEIAEAFTKLRPAPKRTVLFLAVTAEESGLLGAKYYAAHPLYPLERTLANINMDMMNMWGRAKSIVSIGYGNTTLEDLLAELAAAQGRTVKPDPEPEKGFFYRSDHFEFVKRGVPALTFLHSGADYIGRPESYGPQRRKEYTERDYHKPSDEVKPDWDLAGAVEDTQLLFHVGYRVAQGKEYPEWKPGTEFKARREQMLRRDR